MIKQYAGFTLLETLITLILSAGILLILATMFFSLSKMQLRDDFTYKKNVYSDYLRFRRLIRGVLRPFIQGQPVFFVMEKPDFEMEAWVSRGGMVYQDSCDDLLKVKMSYSSFNGLDIQTSNQFAEDDLPDHFNLFRKSSYLNVRMIDGNDQILNSWNSEIQSHLPVTMILELHYPPDKLNQPSYKFFIPIPCGKSQ